MRKNRIFFLLAVSAIILFIVIQNQKASQTNSPVSPVQPSVPETLPAGRQVLTEEERFILNPPSKDASRSALKKHAQIVAELAKESSNLDIQKDCKPDPLVVQIKEDSEIKISNNDMIDRRIIIDSKHFYDIPKNESTIVTAKFKYGHADYGYVCQGVGIVGFLRVR